MSKNVVFIPFIETGDGRSNPYQFSIKSWKYWCEKNDCDLVIFDKPVCDVKDMKITWQRYYVFDILDNSEIEYDQVLMVDADTIIHPDCPNFFNMTDHKFTAVHNEGSYDWVIRSIEIYNKYFFKNVQLPFYEYINGGFQIVNKKHKQFFQDVIKFYFMNKDNLLETQKTFGVGTDQTPINYLLRKHDIDLKLLSYEFNMVDLVRKEILDEELTMTKVGWIYHYNAIPDNADAKKTYYWMEKTYEHLYGKLI